MSLKVWIPFKDGTVKNQGTSNISITNNGATVDNSGKIGKCYNFNNLYLTMPAPLNSSTTYFSISAWVYVTSLANSYGPIYNSRTSGSGGGIVLWMVSSGFRMDDGAEWDLSYSYPTNTWIHICYTRDPSKKKLYLNGALIGEANSGNLSGINTTAYIAKDLIAPSSYYLNGKLNDVRIYDHCLTPQEVKEISKGLVLHYPLNDSATALKSRSTNVTYNLLINLNSNGYTYTFTSNNSSYYVQIANLNTPITTVSGHKYYTRAYISRNISGNNSIYYQLMSPAGGYAIGTGPANGAPDGYYSNIVTLTGTVSNSTYLGIGNYNQKHHFDAGDTVTLKDIVCIDLTAMFGAGNEPTKEEFEELNLHMLTAYNAGTTMNLKEPVYDSSGYNNNGTITGTLTTNTDTSRYGKCTKYMDSASSIGIGNLSTLVPSGVFTFNIWFKRVTGEWSSKGWETIIGGPSGFELLTKRSSTNSPVIVMYSWNNNAENDIPYELDKWNMLTMVRTSAGTIFYLNGDQKKTGNAGSIPSGNYFIGSWSSATSQNFRGMLSDARIYSTALSSDDIKALYNESAFIDHKGNVGCYLFYEDTDSQITKTGQVKTEEFEEISDLSDGVAKVYELKIECNQLIEI